MKGSATSRGYDAAWQRLRLVVLERDGRVCRWCCGYADTVDHDSFMPNRCDNRYAVTPMYQPIHGEDRATGWWAEHHGRARYRKGCRCDVCTAAERLSPRRVPPSA